MPMVIVASGVLTLIASRSVSKSSMMVCAMLFLMAIAVPPFCILFLLLVYTVYWYIFSCWSCFMPV